jgi:hypothetical protein
MEEPLDVLHVQHKGRMMNTLESYHIYEAQKEGIQLNKVLTEPYNQIFEIITKTSQTITAPQPITRSHPTRLIIPYPLPSSPLLPFKFEATNVNIETRHTV